MHKENQRLAICNRESDPDIYCKEQAVVMNKRLKNDLCTLRPANKMKVDKRNKSVIVYTNFALSIVFSLFVPTNESFLRLNVWRKEKI